MTKVILKGFYCPVIPLHLLRFLIPIIAKILKITDDIHYFCFLIFRRISKACNQAFTLPPTPQWLELLWKFTKENASLASFTWSIVSDTPGTSSLLKFSLFLAFWDTALLGPFPVSFYISDYFFLGSSAGTSSHSLNAGAPEGCLWLSSCHVIYLTTYTSSTVMLSTTTHIIMTFKPLLTQDLVSLLDLLDLLMILQSQHI